MREVGAEQRHTLELRLKIDVTSEANRADSEPAWTSPMGGGASHAYHRLPCGSHRRVAAGKLSNILVALRDEATSR